MPKYSEDKIFNHYLYFTSHCTVEAMHVHAGNEEMSEDLAAKFFVRADGSSVLKRRSPGQSPLFCPKEGFPCPGL